jgi:hypothetical protein
MKESNGSSGSLFWVIFIAIIFPISVVAYCNAAPGDDDARRALQSLGFRDIDLGPRRFVDYKFVCSKSDSVLWYAKATNGLG